jgi:hypothetical protein
MPHTKTMNNYLYKIVVRQSSVIRYGNRRKEIILGYYQI